VFDKPLWQAIHRRVGEKLSAAGVLKKYLTAATGAIALEGTITRANAMDVLIVCWDASNHNPEIALPDFESRMRAPNTVDNYKTNQALVAVTKKNNNSTAANFFRAALAQG